MKFILADFTVNYFVRESGETHYFLKHRLLAHFTCMIFEMHALAFSKSSARTVLFYRNV